MSEVHSEETAVRNLTVTKRKFAEMFPTIIAWDVSSPIQRNEINCGCPVCENGTFRTWDERHWCCGCVSRCSEAWNVYVFHCAVFENLLDLIKTPLTVTITVWLTCHSCHHRANQRRTWSSHSFGVSWSQASMPYTRWKVPRRCATSCGWNKSKVSDGKDPLYLCRLR